MPPRKRPAAAAATARSASDGQPEPPVEEDTLENQGVAKKPAKKKRATAKPKASEAAKAHEEPEEAPTETPVDAHQTGDGNERAGDGTPHEKEPVPEATQPEAKKRSRKAKSTPAPKSTPDAVEKSKPKRKKAADKEMPNPFYLPPDEDQARVDDYFAATNPKPKRTGPERKPATDGDKTNEDEGHESSSDDTSSSSTSSLSCSTRVQAILGDLEDDDDDFISQSPCNVQPDQTRSRMSMFSFPTRHVQRLRKHWGHTALETLESHLRQATWIITFVFVSVTSQSSH